MNPRNVPGLNSRGSCMPLVGRPSAPTHAVRAHAPLSAHGTQRCAYSMRGVGVKLAQPSASLELATKGIRSGAYGQAGRGTKQVRCSCLRCPAVSPPCAVGNPQSESEVTTPAAQVKLPPYVHKFTIRALRSPVVMEWGPRLHVLSVSADESISWLQGTPHHLIPPPPHVHHDAWPPRSSCCHSVRIPSPPAPLLVGRMMRSTPRV